MLRLPLPCCVAFLLLASCLARSQDYPLDASSVLIPNQEVRISDLPVQTAASTDSTAVLGAALATVFREPGVCCGPDSALENTVLSANRTPLKELGAKLQGRHVLGNGRPVIVTAEYLPPNLNNPNQIIINLLVNQRPLLMEWNSHLYVLYGAVFDERRYYSGRREFVIHKLLLLDVRFSGARRELYFNREKDDWKQVQGLLMVRAARP